MNINLTKRYKYKLPIDKIKVDKPELKPNETEADWMVRCVPFVMAEGKTREQAVGQCRGIFTNKKQEGWVCECLKCGFIIKTVEHCNILKCPKCGGDMRRTERPGIGKLITNSYIADEDFDIQNTHIKKGQELHYILGPVLEPDEIDATTTDKSIGDIYNEDEVRKAAHYFMSNYKGKGNDFMHDGKDNDDLVIVESYIAPVDMNVNNERIKKGTWMMGTLVLNNKIWELVKGGSITGYSIGGVSNAEYQKII